MFHETMTRQHHVEPSGTTKVEGTTKTETPASPDSAHSPSSRVRSSASQIAAASQDVVIHPEAVTKLAQLLAAQSVSGQMGLDRWKKHELHPKTADQAAVDWIFVADTLNFSFWSEVEDVASPEKFAVEYKGKKWTGYWSCCAAINRALDENIPILDARFLSQISDEEVRHIFRTSTKGEMPMLPERKSNLQEAGKVLLKKYGGSFLNCIRKAEKSSQKLIEVILEDFPSYRDAGNFAGQKVEFYKRAQILVADIWACFEGEDVGAFDDVDCLTIFADYRIPQVLNFFNTMTYSQSLQQKLKNDFVFSYGDVFEMEIRGCSIHVCELLKNELNRILQTTSKGGEAEVNQINQINQVNQVNAIVLDHYLWDYRQLHNDDMKDTPYHKVRCIYY